MNSSVSPILRSLKGEQTLCSCLTMPPSSKRRFELLILLGPSWFCCCHGSLASCHTIPTSPWTLATLPFSYFCSEDVFKEDGSRGHLAHTCSIYTEEQFSILCLDKLLGILQESAEPSVCLETPPLSGQAPCIHLCVCPSSSYIL